MKLLVSPINEQEANEAIVGGADIIDVKNPREGSLGANFPWVIKRIKKITPKNIEVSCTIGEALNLPGSMSLAALGASSLGVDYIKVGLRWSKTAEEAVYFLQNIARAAKEYNSKVKIVAAGYADAARVSGLDPMLIPEIAFKAQVDVALIDTAIKDGNNLFTFLNLQKLQKIVDSTHNFGLEVALAGSLRKDDLLTVFDLGADVAGVRSAACSNGDRNIGKITSKLVHELVETIKNPQRKLSTRL